MRKIFLTAEWRKLAMANYAVHEEVLRPYLPHKTELDLWNNTCYVSLVGFLFKNVRVMGCRIPFHINFEEVNLRFYVRYKEGNEWKRGVVFIKEIVPRRSITLVANTLYSEKYKTMPMRHTWMENEQGLVTEYQWKKNNWYTFKTISEKEPVAMAEGSEAEFITEHFWGYTKVNTQKTSEYGVEHPRWMVYPVTGYTIDVDFAHVYGHEFGFLGQQQPVSVFLAEGSEIVVRKGRTI